MKPIRVVLLAADSRLFRSIRIPEVEIVTPDHAEPVSGETVTQYAALIAEGLFIQPDDIIGGISFGGMLARKIARQRRLVGKVIR